MTLIAAVLAGCYSPSFRDCEVSCAGGKGCPAGLSCESGMCRVAGHGPTCGGGDDDGGIDSPDGADASVTPGAGVIAVAAHDDHTCALCGNGSVWCWGENQHGEVTGSPTNPNCSATEGCNPSPTHVVFTEPATLLALGGRHTCAVHDGGKLACWGLNTSGQFGNGTGTSSTAATDIGTATVLAAGAAHTCVVNSGGTFCAGANNVGQVGDGTMVMRPTPQKLATLGSADALVAGDDHTCALVNTLPYCWGNNDSGQVAAGTTSQSMYLGPHSVGAGLAYTAMALGSQFTCGLMQNHDLQCWGRNAQGQFGTGTAPPAPLPLSTVQNNIAQVAAGGAQMCTISTDNTLRCSGNLLNGETDLPQVMSLPVGRVARQIAVGKRHACAVLDDASLVCWGANDLGQLGNPGTGNGSVNPVAVSVCQ